MRSLAIGLAIVLGFAFVSTDVSARGGGRGGGHGHGGHGGHVSAAHISGARISGRSVRYSRHVHAYHVGRGRIHHGRFVHFRGHRRFYAVRGYGHSCWRWRLTHYGLRRVWVCGYRHRYHLLYRYL
jgi:hypothetical protein